MKINQLSQITSKLPKFDESFLHYVWKFQLFHTDQLCTTNGELLTIIEQGKHNHNAGPDFSDAYIRIGGVEWHGSVEIHIDEGDWFRHKHHTDKAYNNCILHFVLQLEDVCAFNQQGQAIPTVCINNRIDRGLLDRYVELKNNLQTIPCEGMIRKVDKIYWTNWKQKLCVERLHKRAIDLNKNLVKLDNNWEKLIYHQLFAAFGTNINKDAFLHLARLVRPEVINKVKDDAFKIEAILFGQAGLLHSKLKDDYPKSLGKEYLYLKDLYSLGSMSAHEWKFSRLRPANFPSIRLIQLASLLFHQKDLWDLIFSDHDPLSIKESLKNPVSDYWHTHYTFDRTSTKSYKVMGAHQVHSIIINFIIPVRYLLYFRSHDELWRESCLSLLATLKAEKNKITKHWESLGIEINNAAESQALIHLQKKYCSSYRCLDCQIGYQILNRNK